MSTAQERVEKWSSDAQDLKDALIHYDWQYRKKICIKCPLSEQKRRNCFRVDNYRFMRGVKVQETHCKWMDKARVRKFHDVMLGLIQLGLRNTKTQKGIVDG